ncbi:MAG: glycosyltransferase family 9 protein [Deltaproteobacteria bacterium]|nr:glycosyltransferase family 9 protein [Deltaproteobacteria bacterium]
MKKRYPDKTNVLLVNITRLGDMLQATPTIAGMKQENPDCKVTVLVEKQFTEVCHNIPNIDEVVSLDLGMTCRSLAREQDGIIDAFEYVTEAVDDLRSRKFDYCLNMSSSAYTALLLRLVGISRNGGWTSDDEGYRVIESEWAKLFASSVFHLNRQYNSLNLVDVFRCSADVEKHPKQLLIKVTEKAREYVNGLISSHGFTNKGPLIAVQAGASQAKRQWNPQKFTRLINILLDQLNARVILTGSKKELSIIEPISAACGSKNVMVAAGRTDIPQLSAMLEACDILITGDTGPMHISVAVGTPVVAMFLASAFGFETGPYSEGNIVLQPIIGCGPCNPNKACTRPDCHDLIEPELIAELTKLRLQSDFNHLPEGIADSNKVTVYRSSFDEFGFCDLKALNPRRGDQMERFRSAYRKLWLSDLGGFEISPPGKSAPSLRQLDGAIEGMQEVVTCAQEGRRLIGKLLNLIRDESSSPRMLGQLNQELTENDRKIEQLGFHFPQLGPLTRMFIFAKENISGTEAFDLASQMGGIYDDLDRRGRKLAAYIE